MMEIQTNMIQCDDNRPCTKCVEVGSQCTWDKPAKRRGPQNRHAEEHKRRHQGSPLGASSPLNAAQTLASFSRQHISPAETIAPLPILNLLIDDYFTFIHPITPIPHEPSFRGALQTPTDFQDTTFLQTLAAMIGCLVARFPRKVRQHFRHASIDHMFTSSMSMVNQCNKVIMDAQGLTTLDRDYTVHNVIVSYLQGLTYAAISKPQTSLLYFKQCFSIYSVLGMHKEGSQERHINGGSPPRMTSNGATLQGPILPGTDLIVRELSRRTFWALFSSVKSLQQLGVSPLELCIPPSTKTDPHPPLPEETDDGYIYPNQILAMPQGVVSELAGFNAVVRLYTTYESTSITELNEGVNTLVNWERQKKNIERSLEKIKRVAESLPLELSITQPQYTESQDGVPACPLHASSQSLNLGQYHTPQEQQYVARVHIQHEIQKADFFANKIATGSYLVEKYFSLLDAHNRTLSPGHQTDTTMPTEREALIRDFLAVCGTIQHSNIEPNGASFVSKLRQIASALAPHTGGFLTAYLDVLAKLERLAAANNTPTNGTPAEEGQETQLWAELREEQVGFARVGGFGGEV